MDRLRRSPLLPRGALEAHYDTAAVLAHLQKVRPAISKLLERAATLESMEVHGPMDDAVASAVAD